MFIRKRVVTTQDFFGTYNILKLLDMIDEKYVSTLYTYCLFTLVSNYLERPMYNKYVIIVQILQTINYNNSAKWS